MSSRLRWRPMSTSSNMIDLRDVDIVQVEWNEVAQTLWININGECALRVVQPKYLELEVVKDPRIQDEVAHEPDRAGNAH